MRVAILTNAFPPESRGGAGRIASEQDRLLRSAGCEVRVWRPRIVWFSEAPIKRLWRHLRDLSARADVAQEIIEWQPDALITHNLTGCGFATPKRIQRTGVRWIHTLHDVQLFDPSGRVVDAKRLTPWQIFWSLQRQIALGQPDIVISPTAWLKRRHRRRGFFLGSRTRCETVPNPGMPFEHHERSAHVPIRLLFVGRVSRDKGSRLLAGLVRSLKFPYTLTVVGTGPDAYALSSLSPCVTCLGELPVESVRACMMQSDVLLVPSRIEENQPTVILEAASVGLPVIASHKGGIVETLGRAGSLCAPENPPAWIEVLEEWREAGAYAHQVARMEELAQRHDPQVYLSRLLSVLKSKR